MKINFGFQIFILETDPGGNCANHQFFHINIQIKLVHPFKYPFVLNQSLEQRKINFGFQILILILETGPGGIAHKYPNQTCGPFRRSPLF